MFFDRFKKKSSGTKKSYDSEKLIPALRCSICTGEQTAGFKDKKTGEFHDVCLIRNEAELEAFKTEYGITELEKIY